MSTYDDMTIDEVMEMDKLEYVENQNPLRPDELKDPHRIIKIELLGIIATYQDPVCCNRIFRDFEEMNGRVLDPREYGFKSFTSMMRTFSDKFNCHNDGVKTTYTAKTTERSAHLQDLIKNQVTIEEKRRRDMRRSRSFSRSRKSNYGAAFYYSQKFVPLLTDERTQEERLADNLASMGRSWGAKENARGRRDINWGNNGAGSDSSDDENGNERMALRSRSTPPAREKGVFDDPNHKDDLEDCTNPFRTQNNVRIRDMVIEGGEADDTGRKGMALVDVATRFKQQFRQPLGGLPNLSEDRLMSKMLAVQTTEWTVEKMGDGVAYVIIPLETLKKAHEVGPGTPTAPRANESNEKPKNTGLSPAGKRMFGFALKGALSNNNRMEGTREKVQQERLTTNEPQYTGEIVADSDGDPVMLEDPVVEEEEMPKYRQPLRRLSPPPQVGTPIDRDTMMSLSDNDVLEKDVATRVGSMRLLRSQMSPVGSCPVNSSHYVAGSRGGARPQFASRGFQSRSTPPVHPSSMFPNQAPKPTFGGGAPTFGAGAPNRGGASTFGGGVPSFGTNRPPAPANKDDSSSSDESDIIQPSQSNLAFKLPQMAFGSNKSSTPGSAFPSTMGGAPSGISFGTTSQAVPTFTAATPRVSSAPAPPTFGAGASSSSPAQAAFPSSLGAPKISTPTSATQSEKKGSELLGATIQLIGRLQSGAIVRMQEIERTPVEDIVAGNPDFFDIDEKDERIHLLHKDVDPTLLMFDGRMLGEIVAEEKKKSEAPPNEARAGVFSRPTPTFGSSVGAKPTFGGASPVTNEERPTFGSSPRDVPSFGGSRPIQITEMEQRPAQARPGMPTFGAPSGRKMVEVIEEPEPQRPAQVVERPAVPVASSQPVKPLAGMPSFGTKSLEVQSQSRPTSALSNRAEEEPKKVRETPTFGGSRAVPKTATLPDSSDSSDDEGTQESKYTTAPSGISSRNGESISSLSSLSMHSSQETVEAQQTKAIEEVVSTGPYAFPNHKDILSLSKKPYLAFDSVRKNEIHQASILASLDPNRLVMTLVEDDMMDKLQMIMRDLGAAYVDKSPLGGAVKPGQFAVAINGEIVVRVVVLRVTPHEEDTFECACLDFNAVINVDGGSLYELVDKFGVHALRSATFVASVYALTNFSEQGHKAVKMVAKSVEGDESVKTTQPFIFHGKDEVTGDLLVDVAIVLATEVRWMGEAFPLLLNVSRTEEVLRNPHIQKAIDFAAKHGMIEYTNIKEEKEEGELDSSHDESTASERTTVDRHAAGDFVREAKEMKEEMLDEFVVVAPGTAMPILNVESIASVIRLFNAKGENLEVDVIKSMCRALVLSVNKTLSSLGERGSLISNAEALEAIDMV